MTTAAPCHPLERALALARELRATFALSAAEVSWLLARWRDVAAVPLRDDALSLLAQLVETDGERPPLTQREVRDVAAAAVLEFGALEAARGAVQRWAVVRAATAEQRARLDQLVRDEWHAQHGAEATHAA
jgi:hypothetical protein